MNIKKFNIKGNEQYKILLQSVISKDIVTNSDYKSFDDLVRNRNYTEELACTKNIELKDFDNRYELGKYLNDALSDCKHSEIENNENMWNWKTTTAPVVPHFSTCYPCISRSVLKTMRPRREKIMGQQKVPLQNKTGRLESPI